MGDDGVKMTVTIARDVWHRALVSRLPAESIAFVFLDSGVRPFTEISPRKKAEGEEERKERG